VKVVITDTKSRVFYKWKNGGILQRQEKSLQSIPAKKNEGGIGRIYGDYLNTGIFSLVFKHLPNQSEPGVVRKEKREKVVCSDS
jgi:hypothetical protein